MKLDEKTLEDFIADWLVAHGGYNALKVGTLGEYSKDFDPVRGLDLVELFAFTDATQADEWEQADSSMAEVKKRLGPSSPIVSPGR